MIRIKTIQKVMSCVTAAMLCTTCIGLNSFAEESDTEDAPLYEQTPVTQFRVDNLSPQVETDMDYTDWWYSKWEDCHYIFLPATADRTQLTVTYETEDDTQLYLNDTLIVSGASTALLSDDEFSIRAGETDCGTLKILQSNVGCMYLDTTNGCIDYLDVHWWTTQNGTALVLDTDGSTQYSGRVARISPHGNSSWDYSDKKSYNIKLASKADLYGMGSAKRWVLLGNYLDHSMLRNNVAMEMARAGGVESVTDSVFIDLFSCGSYRGTYQLTERIGVQDNRVNIRDLEEDTQDLNERELSEYEQKVVGAESASDYIENSYKYFDIPNDPSDITGGYLLQFQMWIRYGYRAESGFITSRGQTIQIDGPEYASEAQVLYIRNFVQEMEDALYSDTGYNSLGKHYSEYIDVDSLIRAYLVQEIVMNSDGTFTSFFLWKDSDRTGDGKLHFGPPWDFDLTCNNYPIAKSNSMGDVGYSSRTDNLYITCFPIDGYDTDLTDTHGSNRPTCGVSWIGQLYRRGDIVKRVSEIYFEEFAPYLDALTGADGESTALVTQMAADILPSAEMNNARWHMYGGRKYCKFNTSSGADFMESAELVRSFLENRKAWLDQLWAPMYSGEGYYLLGDVNVDGKCNASDVRMLQQWLLTAGPMTCMPAADLNQDGKIDAQDLSLMKQNLLH